MTSITATCTNETGATLTFQPFTAVHGTNPVASVTNVPTGQSSVVTATKLDPIGVGPSPEGTFGWTLPGGAGQFVFAYDVHDSPFSIRPTSVPAGYAVPTCSINQSGLAVVTMSS